MRPPWVYLGLKPRALREDRTLQEIHAAGADVRRIFDFYGLNVSATLRYGATLEHPDLTGAPPARPATTYR